MKEHKWQGRWIGAEMAIENRFAPIFKKNFTIAKEIKKAEIFICGLGLFELKINGTLPDDSVLNPAHTQYSQTVLYRVFDVADLLCAGENEITVELGNSFFNETTDVWDWHTASWRSAPKLILDLCIEYADGETEIISTDEAWQVTLDGPITANSIYLGETYDARRTEFAWQNAKEVDAPKGALKPQEPPLIRRIAEFKPKEIRRTENGSCIVTAPEMITGWAKIALNTPENTETVITYGEKLTSDGYVQKIGKFEGHGGEWWPESYIQQDCFISNGNPFEFEPKFSYKGFRYIQIDNCGELCADDITLYRIANDVEVISEFYCSNELVNKLHALMRRTMLNNFQSKPTDTPVWEKNGWLGDANCALPAMMLNFDMSSYMASFTDIMADCFREYGNVPVIVPSADWGTENSPVWNTIFVFAAEALLDYCGKKDYVLRLYPDLKAFAEKDIETLAAQDWVWGKRGLADWLAPMGEEGMEIDPNSSEGAEICGTAFIYAMLKSIIRIAEKLGKSSDIEACESAAEKIYNAFNQKFFKPDLNIYETAFWEQKGLRTKYRQTSNLLPLAFGLVPDEHKKAVAENLVNDIICKGCHLDTGCTGTRFVLPVLFDNGYADVAYKVLTQTTYPSWGYWIESGADSAWESWEPATRSQNHYFLGTFDEALYTHVAGIRNIREGYRKFSICPELECGLEYAKAAIKSPVGAVKCEWKKDDNGAFTVEVEIPDGATADISLCANGKNIKTVCTGGKYIWKLAV